MATIGSLIINLVARTAGFSAGMRKAKADVAGFQASLSGLGTALGGLGLAIGGAFVLKSVIAEAAEAEASMAQLRATLASTGGAAGLTAEQAKAELVAGVEHDAKRQAVLVAREIERKALREAGIKEATQGIIEDLGLTEDEVSA